MKRIISVLIFIIMIMTFSPLQSLAGQGQMVANGSFESLAADGKPKQWNLSGGNFGKEFSVSDDAADGKNSIHIKAEGNAYLSQSVKGFVGGEKYKLSASLKIIDVGTSATIKFQMQNAEGKYVKEFAYDYKDTGKAWKNIEAEFECQEDVVKADILVRIIGGGEIYWDNISLTGETTAPAVTESEAKAFMESPANKEFITNGNFEKVTNNVPSGWTFSKDGIAGTNFTASDKAYEGKSALMISGDKSMYAVQNISGITAGETYRFTARLNFNKSEGSAGLKFEFKDQDKKYMGSAAISSNVFSEYDKKWQEIVFDFSVPEGAASVDVMIRLFEGGEIIWDNVSVLGAKAVQPQSCIIKEPVSGSLNLLEKGDFENVGSEGMQCYGNRWGDIFSIVDDGERGGKVLKVSTAEKVNPWVRFTVTNLQQTAEYQVSAWLKTVSIDGSGPAIKAEFYTGSTVGGENSTMVSQLTSSSFSETGGTWQKVAAQFIVPPGANMAAFYIRLFAAGEIYWDDAECYITGEASHMSINGDLFPYTEWDTASLTANVNDSAYKTPEGSTFKFSLTDSGQNVIDTFTMAAGNEVKYEYPVSLLKEKQKEYKILVEYIGADGNLIDSKTQSVYRYDRPTHLNSDGIFIDHNGDKVFPNVGYHVKPEDYGKAAAAGINVVQCYLTPGNNEAILKLLDKAHENGIMLLIPLYSNMVPAAHPKNIESTKTCIEAVKNHPALYGYMVQDEPGLAVGAVPNMYELLQLSYRTIRDLDPDHVVYICECERSWYEKSGKCCDVLSIDPYPGSQSSKMAVHVSEASIDAEKAGESKRPIYNILQVFKWGGYEPTSNDVRHMAYQALFSGNTGLGLFDVNDFGGADSTGDDLWERECFSGVKGFYEMESDDAFKAFVTGEYPTFAQNTNEKADVWYKLFVKDKDIYAVLINRRAEESSASIPLKSIDGTVSVGTFTAECADISGSPSVSGAGTLNVTLSANKVVRYKLTVGEDLSGLTTSKFDDIYDYGWAKREIDTVSAKGIVNQEAYKKFAPGKKITRAEFAYFLIRTLGLTSSATESFVDVDSNAYYAKELATGKALGILNGIGDNKYSPYAEISRQDMMTIISRGMGLSAEADLSAFSDAGLIADYAASHVKSMIASGLVKGNADGTINPLGNTTRAEAAVIMFRITENE